MKLLDRIFRRSTETRRFEPSWHALSGPGTATGYMTDARGAESLSTVLAAVDAIAGSLGALPCWVYRITPDGRTVEERHPLMRLVRRGPNEHQTWPDFIAWLAASTLLRGNGLSEIVTDPRTGDVTALKPIPWEWASVSLLPSGRLAYDVTEINSLYGGTGRPRRLLQGEVIHLRDRTDDGLIGRSRLQRAAAVVGSARTLQNFVAKMYENGLAPSGALTMKQVLRKDQREDAKAWLEQQQAGVRNAGRLMLLEGGMEYRPLSFTPEDAELLASRRFSVEELARLFGVPGPIIGDLTHGTFTNSETLIRFFATNTLAGWCRKFEAEFSRSLLTDESLQIEMDLSGLLRGDPETRWKSHEIAVRNEILTPNEVREIEGFNPRRGGEQVAQTPAIAGDGDAA